MKICVIGSGYVGLVTGTCLSDSGNEVVCVDVDEEKIASLAGGNCDIFEPGLEEMMRVNLQAGRLRFTSDLRDGLSGAHIVFIAVGTPPNDDGSADLSNVERAAVDLGKMISGPTIVVTKSTVPVGTGAHLEQLIKQNASHPVCLVSNPEFLKEGSALQDFMRPDRVVIGAEDEQAAATVAELYRPFVLNNRPILVMGRTAAEMTKYAANAYLATRISFINEIADVCGRLGVDVDEVRRGMGGDARIGHHFLYPGVGYGGSCFPKDVQALAAVGREAGADCEILAAVHRRNHRQRLLLVEKIRARLGPDLSGRKLALWGLAFKPKTDDIREAPALTIVDALLEAGATVAAHDPHAMENSRVYFGDRIEMCKNAYDALSDADALVIVTEWNEFRSPNFATIRTRLKQPLVFDGRNIFSLEMMERQGIEYHSIGRPVVRPQHEPGRAT